MTDNRIYRATIELPITGSVREERAQIEKLTGLAELEAKVKELGGKFEDGIVRRTGKAVLAGVTQPAPKPAHKPAAE
jgi:hypothetical protein